MMIKKHKIRDVAQLNEGSSRLHQKFMSNHHNSFFNVLPFFHFVCFPRYFASDQVINFFDRQINLCMRAEKKMRKLNTQKASNIALLLLSILSTLSPTLSTLISLLY